MCNCVDMLILVQFHVTLTSYVMFYPSFVWLSVCLLAASCKNCSSEFHENFVADVLLEFGQDVPLTFGSHLGPGSKCRLGLSHWDPYAVSRGSCLELYYCNTAEWCWWDSSVICKTNWFPSVHCFDAVGLAIWPVKIVPDMTYNVLSGTLSLYTTAPNADWILVWIPLLELANESLWIKQH